MIGDQELQREARRVLRRLLGEDAVLARASDGWFGVLLNGKPDRPRTRVKPEIVAGFRARDWIAPRRTTPESFVLSEAGEAWYRRTLADGDPFAAQHQLRVRRVVIDAQGVEHDVVVNEAESPLTRLKTRKLIDATQCEAGERLRRDFTLAQLSPRLGVDLTAPVVLGKRGAQRGDTLTETVLAAKQRFSLAMRAMGPGLSDLLFDVCCHLIGLEDAERSFGWPSRAGRVVLVIALDRLAQHYGMRVIGPRHAPIRSWQAPKASSDSDACRQG
jgi:GGDEF domain-containing protein